ncbi:IgGFc-binding protein-like isoform X2 [Mercenaria mercenaria]|nr:IgGFc-binding protein-like isoform X2 [Mercenaria mercenaria]
MFGLIGYYERVTSANATIQLHLTPELQVSTHVRVTAPFINMNRTYTVSNYTVILLHGRLIQFENGTQYKGTEVISDLNISLTVFISGVSDIAEGFLALPLSALGTRYIAASYTPTYPYSSEILIAGVENDTDVILSTVIDGKRNTYLTFQLQKFETYQFKVNNDVSGSIVTSSKPVAIFSGSALAHVPAGIGDWQYLVEQMIPTKYWTTRFIVPPIYPRRHFVVKLFTDQDNTEVHYYNSTDHFALNMNKMTSVELLFSTDPVTVLANKPISVIQYGHNGDKMAGDPFMSTTQGITQFKNSYKFVTQKYYSRVGSNTIAITILKNSTGGLLLNGHSMSYWSAKNVSVSPPLDQYTTLFVNAIHNSYFHLYHSDGIKFGAIIYGRPGNLVAYGYPLQLSFTNKDCGKHEVSLTTVATTHAQTTTVTKPVYSNSTFQGGKSILVGLYI